MPGQLGIVFNLTSNAAGLSRGFGQANREMSGFQARARAFGRAAAIPLAAVGVAGARAAVQLVGEFEEAQKIITQGTGATGETLRGLTDDMRASFGQVPQSMAEVAQATADINTRFGTTGQTLQDQTRLFLDFSRVTGTQVSTAVSTLAAQLTNFGEPVSSLNESLGDMVRIQQATGLAGETMARQFNDYGPLFANLGLTVEQTAAVFGQLAQSNIAVSRVAPGLNAFIRNMSALGKDPLTALREVVDEIQDATEFTDAMNTAMEAFGAEGAQRMTTAIRAGNFDIREFNGLLGAGAGIVQEQGEEMLTLGERFSRIGNQLKASATPALSSFANAAADVLDTFRTDGFGAAVSQAFDQIGDAGGRAFSRFTDWARDNKVLAGGMTLVAGAALTLFTRAHPLIAVFATLSAAWAALQGDNVALQLTAIAAAALAVGVAVSRVTTAFLAMRGAAAAAAAAQGAAGLAGLAGGVGGVGRAGGAARGLGIAGRFGLAGAAITAGFLGVAALTRQASEEREQETVEEELTRLRGYTGRRGVQVRGRIRELEQQQRSTLGFGDVTESARRDRGIGVGFEGLVNAARAVAEGTATRADLERLQDPEADPITVQLAQQAAQAQMQAAGAQVEAADAQAEASAAMLASIGPESTFGDQLRAAEGRDADYSYDDFRADNKTRIAQNEEYANSFAGFVAHYNDQTDEQIRAVAENTDLSSKERAEQIAEIKASREDSATFHSAAVSATLGIGDDTRWVGMQVEGLGPLMNAGFGQVIGAITNLPAPVVDIVNEIRTVAPNINWQPVFNISVSDPGRAAAIVRDMNTAISAGLDLEDIAGRLFRGERYVGVR